MTCRRILISKGLSIAIAICLIEGFIQITQSFVPSSTSFVPRLSTTSSSSQCQTPSCSNPTLLFMAGMSRKANKEEEKKEEQTSGRLLKELVDMADGGGSGDNEEVEDADDINFLKKVQAIEEAAEIEMMQQEAAERQKQAMEESSEAMEATHTDKATESVIGGAESPADNVALDKRPEVTQFNVEVKMQDGTVERIPFVQGQKIMDIITRKAVKLSDLGPMYRLAQMFPGAPPDIREQYRLNDKDYWSGKIKLPEIIEKFKEVSYVKNDDGTMSLPRHPCVRNSAIDFVTANRDLLGYKFGLALNKLVLRNAWQENYEMVKEMRGLTIHFITIEKYLVGPFRQCMLDSEERTGPNFGNMNLTDYCGTELYERTADYLVLKSIVEHWVRKLNDAELIDSIDATPDNLQELLFIGDPKRYLPDSEVIWQKNDCQKIAAMALKMCNEFVETPELFDDLPVEVRFYERVSKLPLNVAIETDEKLQREGFIGQEYKLVGGTAIRKFMLEEFCPSEGIDPSALREGLRRLHESFHNMQIDPYGDITDRLQMILEAIKEGTGEERQPMDEYLFDYGDPESPGYFESYTFNVPYESRIRFLDQFISDDPDPEDRFAVENVQRNVQKIGEGTVEAAKGLLDFSDFLPDVRELPIIGDMMDSSPDEPIRQDDYNGELDEDGYRTQENYVYRPPAGRALGRPHEGEPGAGWWKYIDQAAIESYRKDGLLTDEAEEEAKAKNQKPVVKTYEPGYIIAD